MVTKRGTTKHRVHPPFRTATRNHPPSPRGRDEELKICGAMAQVRRPVPFRTRKLRPGTAMVLHPERMWESSTPPHSPSQGPPVEHHAPGGSLLHPHPQKTHPRTRRLWTPRVIPVPPRTHQPQTPDQAAQTPKASRIPQPTRKHTLKTTDRTSTGDISISVVTMYDIGHTQRREGYAIQHDRHHRRQSLAGGPRRDAVERQEPPGGLTKSSAR